MVLASSALDLCPDRTIVFLRVRDRLLHLPKTVDHAAKASVLEKPEVGRILRAYKPWLCPVATTAALTTQNSNFSISENKRLPSTHCSLGFVCDCRRVSLDSDPRPAAWYV